MADKAITLHLPELLYEQVQALALASERSIEAVLAESLQVMFQLPEQAVNLEILATYTDVQLWALVLRQMPAEYSARLRQLEADSVSDAEADELERLLALVDEAMLLRSEALRLLKLRGHDISLYIPSASE